MDANTVKGAVGSTVVGKTLLQHIRWEHLAAGISGGVVATLVLHPLDLVKIRFQVNEGIGITNRPQYNGMLDALRSICKTNGFAGLYQGVTPNVWGAGSSWGLYFFFYNNIKTWMQGGDAKYALGPGRHIVAASEAGLLTLILTNPLWVAKTRLCLQYEQSAGATTKGVYYNGTVDALLKIYRLEGVRGLYKGFVPGVFGISHGAIQFMIYEEMKNKYNIYFNRSVDTRLVRGSTGPVQGSSRVFVACNSKHLHCLYDVRVRYQLGQESRCGGQITRLKSDQRSLGHSVIALMNLYVHKKLGKWQMLFILLWILIFIQHICEWTYFL